MVNKIKELVKNVNFDLRLAECVICLVSVLSYCIGVIVDENYIIGQREWLIFSLAFVVVHVFEKPNFGLEIGLLVIYYVPVSIALTYLTWSFSIGFVCLAITALLMFIDIIFIISHMDK